MDFFDKVKDGLSKGIDTIGAKGKEFVEDAQAQLQISSLRDKREKALAELGALAYALFQTGALADEGVNALCATIASLERQIAAKEAELRRDDGTATAASEAGSAPAQCECGAETARGMKFCSFCGRRLG